MREPTLTQRARFILLLFDVAILCAASWIVYGWIFPPNNDKGFWFYTALLGLILGSRLDTPFFAKPADVVLYAAPAAIALALVNTWSVWNSGVQVAYCCALAFCITAGVLGATAIMAVNTKSEFWQHVSNAARVLAETLGAPRTIYSVVIAFALYAFNSSSTRELGIIGGAWVLTGVLSPLEAFLKISRRLKRIFCSDTRFEADGEVVAYQTPGLILIRQAASSIIKLCDVAAVHDPLGHVRMVVALDHVGRDQGMLLRTIEIPDSEISDEIVLRSSQLPPNSVICVSLDKAGIENQLIQKKEAIVGIVAPDTSVERLFFEVVKDEDLEEGRLVEVQIGKRFVTYQLVNGLTKEEIVQQKNTHGFARAQAQKIGRWDEVNSRFTFAKWLPTPNAPVFLKDSTGFQLVSNAIGHFPGTSYPVMIENINAMVTHNTAILGILGVGKSMLAIELVERMMAVGIKVICVDLTSQYATELASYYDEARETVALAHLQQIGVAGKTRVRQNVEDCGSRNEFSEAVLQQISEFLSPACPRRLKILNPSRFEVWRQDSRPFNNTASMASLSPAEITHIISKAALEAASALGMTDEARVCLVYEEAHSLVPEWNSAVDGGDQVASNGSARAILQGRKYGLGCLLVTQRTANVTKTILNQCNTIFAMRTFDDSGKNFLANYIGSDYASSLPSLFERQAVFFGRASSCENPILIQLNDRDKFLEVFREANPPPPIEPAEEIQVPAEPDDDDIPF